MSDLISRQAAIDEINKRIKAAIDWFKRCDDADVNDVKVRAEQAIATFCEASLTLKSLPSVQPDMSGYSDRLWKLAYERGKRDAQQEWIPVTERQPDEDGYYLVTGKKRAVHITGYSNGWWYGGEKPIAWIPLPEPYKEGE